MGTSFYISADTYRDHIKRRLQDGVDIHFLVLDPESGNLERVAAMLNTSSKELADQCRSGIRTFAAIQKEVESAKYSGRLEIRMANEELYSRIHFFDPGADDGITYYVPQVNRLNSELLPGFLVKNGVAKFHSIYFSGIRRLWDDPSTKSFDAWKALHPTFL